MKPIKKMQADQVYLIRGASTANSPFFEKETDCKLFLRLADRYLGQFVSINRYQNSRDGWLMIITTKSAEEIQKAYKARRALSKKCNPKFEFKEIWRMLSDQVRIFLSAYVKATNELTGREGGKVRSRYKRFVFESADEAREIAASLAKKFYSQAQPKKRYRPSRRLHKIRKKLLKTSIYISCRLLGIPEKARELGMRSLDLCGFDENVVRQVIKSTYIHHFPD